MLRLVLALLLALALAPLCGTAARAQTASPAPTGCVVPFIFQPLTVANANQVNSNFSTLATCINLINVGAVQCSGLATCIPESGYTEIFVPTPSATSTSTTGPPSATWNGFQLAVNFPVAGSSQATPSPSATSTSTAGPPSCTWSGSFPYTLNCNFPAVAAVSGITLQTAPSPSPQGGYAALAGAFIWDNPSASLTALYIGPNPTPSPTYYPAAIQVSEGTGGGTCSNGYLVDWGTTSATTQGVEGDMFSVTCANGSGGPWLAVDGHGNLGVYSSIYPDAAGNGLAMQVVNGDELSFLASSSTVNNCILKTNAGWGGLQIGNSGGGTCSLALTDLAPSTTVCLGTSAQHTILTNCAEGQVTCSLSGTSACSATASPIPTGRICTATYDAVATTVTPVPDLQPITLKVVGNVLTVYMDTSASLTGALAADFKC